MSSKKPEERVENPGEGCRTTYLPSVNPDCYRLIARSLDLRAKEFRGFRYELLAASQNWGILRQIVQPAADLVVKDILGQHFVDDVRHRFDAIRDPYNDGVERSFILCLMKWGDGKGNAEVLKMLLTVGLDPDLDATSPQSRPSHECGAFGRLDLAKLIFPCRPRMTAVNKEGLTPLSAASEDTDYTDDDRHPRRKSSRRKVRNYIIAGGFETKFPSLAELAFEKSWFAVKNLLRRQVVAESEFTEKLEGKTAAEWAQFLKKPGIAQEIRYYAAASSNRPTDSAAKEMTALVEKLRHTENERSVLSSKVIKLEKTNEEFRNETVAKDAKIEELMEVVSVLQSRLDEAAGVGLNSRKRPLGSGIRKTQN